MMRNCDVVVVDDERSVRDGLSAALTQAGLTAETCEGIGAARITLEGLNPGCMLLDVRLKDGNGLDFLTELRRTRPEIPVIIATAYGDSERTIRAMRDGAFNYVTKPFDLDALLASVRRAMQRPERSPRPVVDNSSIKLVGESPPMLEVWKAIGRAASSDAAVLITGETGVGKELVAHAIHENSGRRDASFVAVNVAALPANLVESELFGHEKGAFTGANARREGRFESAAGGTIFLDEIGDLELAMQTKLLRVLQDGEFDRVGGQSACTSSARVISATSQPVGPKGSGSNLREDLFYRLSVIEIVVPPLRERRSDIPLLVDTFFARQSGPHRSVTDVAMQMLAAASWPGNVRELHHVLERACVMSTAAILDEADFALVNQTPGAVSDDLDLRTATANLERDFILRALKRTGGNRAEAARLLGVARPQLYAMMKTLGVVPPAKE